MADDPKPDYVWGYTYRLVTDEGDVKLTREDITYEGWAQIKADRERMRAAARKPRWAKRVTDWWFSHRDTERHFWVGYVCGALAASIGGAVLGGLLHG